MAFASAARRSAPLHWGFVVWGALCLLLYGGTARAANTATATSSRAAREDALRSIPFDRIDPAVRKRVRQVVNKPSIYRRLPVQVTDCDPAMFQFLVTHPEVVVSIWQAMGISKVTLARQSDGSYSAADGVGTRGVVRFCFSNHDTHVVLAEGAYEGPLFEKPVRAQCVLVFKHGHVRETNGRDYITTRCDTFISIDHVGVELLARTFSPLVIKSADSNFSETAAFLGNLSRTAEANPAGVSRLARRLQQVDPQVRDQFVALSAQVAQNRRTTAAAAPEQPAQATSGQPADRNPVKTADRRAQRPTGARAQPNPGTAESSQAADADQVQTSAQTETAADNESATATDLEVSLSPEADSTLSPVPGGTSSDTDSEPESDNS